MNSHPLTPTRIIAATVTTAVLFTACSSDSTQTTGIGLNGSATEPPSLDQDDTVRDELAPPESPSAGPVTSGPNHDSGPHETTAGAAADGAAMTLVDPATATHVAAASGAWSAPATWSTGAVPDVGSRVAARVVPWGRRP